MRREMVTSVNSSLLAALQAQEQALANRIAEGQTPGQTQTATDAASAQNPAVVYAGSSGAPDLSAVLSAQDSLNRAAGVSDVGVNAGQTISGLITLLREKVAAAQSGGGDASALNTDYQQLLQTIDQLAQSASFQGTTMLDGGSSGDLTFSTGVSGDSTASLTPQDFTVGGPTIGLAGTDLLGSSDDLAALLGQVDAASGALGVQLSQMNSQAAQIQTQLGAVTQLSSALAGGGAPDLDADSARLQALQIQQALAGQTQGVANQAPQALLSLFR
jgi:flagellin